MPEKVNATPKQSKTPIIISIFSLVVAATFAFNSRVLDFVFEGKLDETIIPSAYKEKINGRNLYLSKFKYRYVSGQYSIEDLSISLRLNNKNSRILDFDFDFHDTMSKDYISKKQRDLDHIRIELKKMRKLDEFDLLVYTDKIPDFSKPVVRMEKGSVNTGPEGVRNGAYWIFTLILASFGVFVYFCRRVTKTLETEKQRIIDERNRLQDEILKGKRRGSSPRL